MPQLNLDHLISVIKIIQTMSAVVDYVSSEQLPVKFVREY